MNRKRVFTWALATLLAIGATVPAMAILGIGDIVFDPTNYEEAIQHLIQLQQQYVVSDTPKTPIDFFPTVPAVSDLPGSQTVPTIYQISPRLHSPYVLQSAVSVERQLTKIANVAVSYLNARGVHQFLSVNANLSIRFGGDPQAEPADRQLQYSGRHEADSVRVLFAELRQQQRFGHLQLSVGPVRSEPGLRARFV